MNSIYYEIAQDLYRDLILNSRVRMVQPYPIANYAMGNQEVSPEGNVLSDISMEPPETEQLETFTLSQSTSLYAFSGSDLVVTIDGSPVGEMQAIYYHKISPLMAGLLMRDKNYLDAHLLNEYPIVMLAIYSAFIDDPVHRPEPGQTMNIVMTYANENGQRAEERFTGVDVYSEFGGMSVDAILNERVVIMIAKEHMPMVSM